MDQKPRPISNFSMFQTSQAVTCQILTNQMTPTIVSPSTSNYVLTAANLRPVTNYTLVASSQIPVTHQYVLQPATRTTIPQYANASNVRHILSSSSQPSNVTYMLPSGAQLVKMNNAITTTIAGDHKSNTQFILTSSSQKLNSSIISPLGSQSSKTIATAAENNSGSSGVVTRTINITTSTTPIIQRPGLNLPKLNTAYYSQIKGNEHPKIALRPKTSEQKSGTSIILTSNVNKNVPISSLQKINTNYMHIPIIQKSGTVISANALKSNDIQQQKTQPQPQLRSVILPSNYRTAVSQQQGTESKLVLNSINVPTQILNSNDSKPSTSSTPVSNIQHLNTSYMQIPLTQKPATIITRNNNTQSNVENNICIGQQPQTIRSVILPSNYRTAMIGTPRKNSDYRFIIKPFNMQPQMLRNIPPSRYTSPRNSSVRNASPRQSAPPVRPVSNPTRLPVTRPSTSRVQNEIIANSKITPIPLKDRKGHLMISEGSIQICIDEINNKCLLDNQPNLNLTKPAIKLLQTEVTYRLFYLLRECKKFLIRIRSNVLTEEAVRHVCSEYFATFYGNKLWPLFCLKQNDDDSKNKNDENRIWMRKHNNVNLVGWLKHPKFRNPSYIRKRRKNNLINSNMSLSDLIKVSENVYEFTKSTQDNQESEGPPTTMQVYYQSLKNNQVSLINMLPKVIDNDSKDNSDIINLTSNTYMDVSHASQIPSTSKQIPR